MPSLPVSLPVKIFEANGWLRSNVLSLGWETTTISSRLCILDESFALISFPSFPDASGLAAVLPVELCAITQQMEANTIFLQFMGAKLLQTRVLCNPNKL